MNVLLDKLNLIAVNRGACSGPDAWLDSGSAKGIAIPIKPMPASRAATTRRGCHDSGTTRGRRMDPRAMPPMKLASSAATEKEDAPTTSSTR